MAELTSGKNESLYMHLGISHLMELPEVEEDPRLPEDGTANFHTMETFIAYFAARDHMHSPAAGYAGRANDLRKQLMRIAFPPGSETGSPKTQLRFVVNLRPDSVTDPKILANLSPRQQVAYVEPKRAQSGRLYDFEETSGSKAFRGAIDGLLQPEAVGSSPDWPGAILYKASFSIPMGSTVGGVPIERAPESREQARPVRLWMAETKARDDVGGYTELTLWTRRPAVFLSLLTQPREGVPFMTTGQEQEIRSLRLAPVIGEWNQLLDGIFDLPEAARREVIKQIPKVENVSEIDLSKILQLIADTSGATTPAEQSL